MKILMVYGQYTLLALLLASVLTELVGCKQGGKMLDIREELQVIGQLNDTGILMCANATQVQQSCPQQGLEHQDAEFGRDADKSLKKQGAGVAGFDWTKLNGQGKALTIQNQGWLDRGNESDGTRWSCVQDNVTGLMWEIKEVDPNHPRYAGHTYSWWMDSEVLNGGFDHRFIPGNCVGLDVCETQAYVNWINKETHCGYADWRLPSIGELSSIAVLSNERPALDNAYFPDAIQPRFFTNQTHANDSSRAWYVYFSDGSVSSTGKGDASAVRLVRGGQK
jgi:hypothetical protein